MDDDNEQMGFDLKAGEALKAGGIATVSSHTPEDWAKAFEEQVLDFVRLGSQFTSEDVTQLVGQPPNHPNAVGARMNAMARRGFIKRVGFRKAERKNQHATVIGVWEAKYE